MNYNFWLIFCMALIMCLMSVKTNNLHIKRVSGIVSLFLVFIITSSVVIGKNSVFGDLIGFEKNYLNPTLRNFSASYQSGYNAVVSLSNMMGLSFGVFKAYIVMFTLACYYAFTEKYTLNIGYFLLFYIIHEALFDSSTLRNTLAWGLIIIGIIFLLGNGKSNIIIFIVITMIASTIHSASMFYIILSIPFINKTRIKKVGIVYFILFMTVCILMYTSKTFLSLLRSIARMLFDSQRYSSYAVQGTRLGCLPVFFCWALTIWNVIRMSKYCDDNTSSSVVKSVRSSNCKLMFSYERIPLCQVMRSIKNVLLASCMLLPLSILTLHFVRLIRNMTVVYLVASSIIIGSKVENKNIKIQTLVINIVSTSIWIWFDSCVYGAFDWQSITDYAIKGTWFWLQ